MQACSDGSFLTGISIYIFWCTQYTHYSYIVLGIDINIRYCSLRCNSTAYANLKKKKVTDWSSFQRSLNFYCYKKDGTFSLFPYFKILFTFSALSKNVFMTKTHVLEFSFSIKTRNTFEQYQWPSACAELSTQMSAGGSQWPYHLSWRKVRRFMHTSERFQTQWFQLISCFLWLHL